SFPNAPAALAQSSPRGFCLGHCLRKPVPRSAPSFARAPRTSPLLSVGSSRAFQRFLEIPAAMPQRKQPWIFALPVPRPLPRQRQSPAPHESPFREWLSPRRDNPHRCSRSLPREAAAGPRSRRRVPSTESAALRTFLFLPSVRHRSFAPEPANHHF